MCVHVSVYARVYVWTHLMSPAIVSHLRSHRHPQIEIFNFKDFINPESLKSTERNPFLVPHFDFYITLYGILALFCECCKNVQRKRVKLNVEKKYRDCD